MTDSRAVLTLGLGKPIYIHMASTLARSFRCWHRESDIDFAIVTDNPGQIPEDVKEFVDLVPVERGQYGLGFSPKLHLDELIPADQTLFVDADCLIVGSLEPVFDRFAGHSVSTVGRMISQGDWWGDVAERCEIVGVEEAPVLVGCVYYLEDDSTARQVYENARSLKERYEELGLIHLRGLPNEEPLMSLAMALHGQSPIPDDGTIKADAMSYPSKIEMDVINGHALFKDETDQESLTGRCAEARPVIAHFNNNYATKIPYTREATRLRKLQRDGWPIWAANLYADGCHTVPESALKAIKNSLRPVYHSLFGPRHKKENPRV